MKLYCCWMSQTSSMQEGWWVSSSEWLVCLFSVQFVVCTLGKMAQDVGMILKVLWCCSHLVCLLLRIPFLHALTCFHSENFFVTCESSALTQKDLEKANVEVKRSIEREAAKPQKEFPPTMESTYSCVCDGLKHNSTLPWFQLWSSHFSQITCKLLPYETRWCNKNLYVWLPIAKFKFRQCLFLAAWRPFCQIEFLPNFPVRYVVVCVVASRQKSFKAFS